MLAANQIINKLIDTKDFNFIKTNSLDARYFTGYELEFQFIMDHYKKYGNIPDDLTFLSKFQDFERIEVNETNDYLLDKLYEEYGYQQFATIIPQLNNCLKEDSRKAYDFLKTQMALLKPHSVCKGIDIIEQAIERYNKYLERCTNQENATIKTGLIELDEIFGGWEYGDELVTIVARTNMGKCFSKGTLIRMADGTCKKVEDIQIGDKVQSYNQINTVTQLHKGNSKGYMIKPLRAGEPFTITDDHIMTLWHRKQVWDPIRKQSTTNGNGELIDITIEEFLNKSKSFQNNCFLFRPAINYETKEQKIPAYILGLWLGDGTSSRTELTSMDESIYNEWCSYGKSLNLKINISDHGSKAKCYTFYNEDNKNTFKELLNDYNLLNNKHIPLNYLTGDKAQRLELLAGLIDTDGYYNKKLRMYEITTKSEQLAKDYCQLIRGLGYKVNKRITHNKVYKKDYYRISFSGLLNEIPCKLEYKKVNSNHISLRNSNISRFEVERIEEPFEYFGFACDGDHRFLLEDNTLTHNSWILLKFLAEAWKQGKRVGLYSGEMSHLKLGYRFDALFEHFSNRALVRGLPVDGYKEYIDNLITQNSDNRCFQIITQKEFNGRPTVQKIRNFIEENNIEIMGIDQYSLMDDGRANHRDPTRLRLAHIAEDLFLLSSEYKIPILGLCQANRDGVNKDDQTQAPGLENIKESDDISHNSSKCIGMRQSNFGLVLDVIKNREGRVGDKLLYSWDIDTGHFAYIPSADDAARPETRQQFTEQNRAQFAPSQSVNPF